MASMLYACGSSISQSYIEIEDTCYRNKFIEYIKINKISHETHGSRVMAKSESEAGLERFNRAAQEFMSYMAIQKTFDEKCMTAAEK